MMEEKECWFCGWEITYLKDGMIKVSLPHEKTGIGHVVFTGVLAENEGVRWIIDCLDCALTELTKRK